MTCEHCAAATEATGFQGVYALDRPCCAGRFIANIPGVERRRAVLQVYKENCGTEFLAALKLEIVQRLKAKRKP